MQAAGDHYLSADSVLGNNTLLAPLYGNDADFYERVQPINAGIQDDPDAAQRQPDACLAAQ